MATDPGTSIQSLKRYLKHAQSCGVDCTPLLIKTGIDPQLLDDNTNRIATDKLLQFLRAAIIASQDPCFGLNASRLIQPDTFDILGYIALNCATLRQAMEQVIVYESISGTSGNTELIPVGDQVMIRWSSHVEDPLIRRHSEENVIASWYRYAHQIVNLDDRPSEVWFTHSAPNIDDLSIYQQVFQCEVFFDKAYSGLLVQADKLDIPFPQANRDMLQLLQQQAEQQLQKNQQQPNTANVSQQVSNLIRLMINERIPSKELIAEQLGVSGRTLQRQLEQEGQSYKTLLQRIRQEMAQHYLKNSDLSIETISRKVGFADVRSFQRSFKQWTGMTPGACRE